MFKDSFRNDDYFNYQPRHSPFMRLAESKKLMNSHEYFLFVDMLSEPINENNLLNQNQNSSGNGNLLIFLRF